VQISLGLMYSRGLGVIQDNVYAHMWFNISASLGNELGAKNRDTVASQMTAEQITEAQRLARECAAKDYKGC
jgi:TPR repeat protein